MTFEPMPRDVADAGEMRDVKKGELIVRTKMGFLLIAAMLIPVRAMAGDPIKSNDSDVKNLLVQGKKALDGGDFNAAITKYQKAMAIQPDDAEAHNGLGLALAGRGRIDEAITPTSGKLVIGFSVRQRHVPAKFASSAAEA
jgi:hypothetical protein